MRRQAVALRQLAEELNQVDRVSSDLGISSISVECDEERYSFKCCGKTREGIVQDDYQIEGIEQALVGYDDIVAGDGCQ